MSHHKPSPNTPDPANAPAFSGSMPRQYHARLVPILFRDYAKDLSRRVGPIENGSVLETAAGTGVVTQELRAGLPHSTTLTATDFSPDMLEISKEFLPEPARAGVRYLPADATDLPFDDGSFDAVACQFGVMFFPDEPRGYREAARVLKPRGRFLFSVWDDLARNPIAGCLHEVFGSLSPDNPPRFFQTPYRDLDTTTIVRNLQAAGFGAIVATVLPKPCRVASAVHAVEAFVQSSPLGLQTAERGTTEAGSAAGALALANRFAQGDPTAPFTAPMQAVVFEAFKAE